MVDESAECPKAFGAGVHEVISAAMVRPPTVCRIPLASAFEIPRHEGPPKLEGVHLMFHNGTVSCLKRDIKLGKNKFFISS